MWDWVWDAFCSYIISWLPLARNYFFPLARNYFFPLARNYFFILAIGHLLPVLKEGVNIIRGIPNDKIVELKKELESIEEFIHQADKVADAEGDDQSHGTREKIKQLIEASFRIQDAIDQYIIREEQQLPYFGCATGVNFVKTKFLRLQIAHNIHSINSQINEMKDTSSKKDHEGSSSSVTNLNTTLFQNLRKAPFKMREADVVGFEKPRDKLVDWLVRGRDDLTVVSVVAMGGQGKTTLAKQVFDSKEVKGLFDCLVWITVSQSYNIEELLRGLLKELCKQQNVSQETNKETNKESLVDEVSNYLQEKRYVVVFDDVWNSSFWADIKFALSDKQKGCRILITTRFMDVATSCRESFVKIHELKGLDDEQSLKLFNKKAFYDLEEVCPPNLFDITSKIVKKCGGLPLAIVVTGGVLCKNRNKREWDKFNENIKPKFKEDYSVINKILVLSYHDLPYNLKSCLLYFGIYPKDCKVNSKRLSRQWIAEGFVKEVKGMTLEEVAEEYLTELIHRSQVQVVSINVDGSVESCRVHDLVHDMILKKFEDLSFCKNISEDGQSTSNGIVRRISITTNSDVESIESLQVRSLLVLEPYTIHESFVRQITKKYRLLKVFDAKFAEDIEFPKDLGSLNHLKYFGIKTGTDAFTVLPKSIGMLENLETLDLTGTPIYIFPKEICKLKKLQHFLGKYLDLVQLKDGIGEMTSLQTLSLVCLRGEDDEDLELIEELGKLKKLKELALIGVMRNHMSVLSSSINKMQQLEKLSIQSDQDIIDLDLNLPKLQYLVLKGQLEKLPEWIPKHQHLVILQLFSSKLTEDSMKLLGSMRNLLSIYLLQDAYVGETLHFKNERFKNLKELHLNGLNKLKYIHIDQGALPSLERMRIYIAARFQRLPTGIQHLKKLQYLRINYVSEEFTENILLNGGKDHWIFKQVPNVNI